MVLSRDLGLSTTSIMKTQKKTNSLLHPLNHWRQNTAGAKSVLFVSLSSICMGSQTQKVALSFQGIFNPICKQRHLALLDSSRSKSALFRYGLTLLGQLPSSPGPCASQDGLKVRGGAISWEPDENPQESKGWPACTWVGLSSRQGSSKSKGPGVGMAPGLLHEKWIS